MISSKGNINADVVIVGASLSAAAAAKRLVDAGYEAIAIERHALPRHKTCSGILSPRGHRFLIENFGPLPREILHEPTSCRGVTFHFPSMRSVPVEFDGGPTPHLYRMNSDYWAIRQSRVTVHDGTSFNGLEDKEDHVIVSARRWGEDVRYRARLVIAADGPNSPTVRTLYPGYRKKILWFMVKQHMHDIIECPLDADYFHFWFHPELGHYTWSHRRDGRQIVGVGSEAGDDFGRRHALVVDYLDKRHGVRLAPATEREASVNNFGLSLINRYVFGKGNVIVTGQAAGFLNMIAEGMSCALHSGAIAGEAAIESLRISRPLQEIYRGMIASEVRRCSDQWNPLKIAFGRPHEGDFWGAVKKQGLSKWSIAGEIIDFTKIYAPYKWGRQMLWQAIARQVMDGYMPSRWL